MPVSEIVRPETIERLGEELKKLDKLDIEIRNAKRAGIPVEEAEKISSSVRDRITQIRQVYAPGRIE